MKFNDLSITIHTDKIKECVDFYVRHFDVKIAFDCGWYVTIQFQSDENPNIFISFIKPEYGSINTEFSGGLTLNLNVSDVDAEYAKIQPAGLTFMEDITDHEWGDRAFSVKDPLGNILYIYSPREMSAEYQNAVKE
jgi:predicted enzyme related to lactoylglutathione lyase